MHLSGDVEMCDVKSCRGYLAAPSGYESLFLTGNVSSRITRDVEDFGVPPQSFKSEGALDGFGRSSYMMVT